MEAIQLFFEILKYTVPSIVVFFTAYFLMKNQSDENLAKIKLEMNRQNQSTLSPLKLQAYERIILFLERISPQQLILTHNDPSINVFLTKHAMINAVQQEYNYNLSQQIYISSQAWTVVKIVKEQVINLINSSSEGIDDKASGTDLSRAIIEKLQQNGEQPTEKAINFIKAEVAIYFG
jgi:hypothetical protein